MTNIFYRPIIFIECFFYRPTIFNDFFFFFLISILSYFRQLEFFGDIPLPFLVVKKSKCLKINNTKVGYFQFKFWKDHIKSGLVNFFACRSYNSWTQKVYDYNWERTFYSQHPNNKITTWNQTLDKVNIKHKQLSKSTVR